MKAFMKCEPLIHVASANAQMAWEIQHGLPTVVFILNHAATFAHMKMSEYFKGQCVFVEITEKMCEPDVFGPPSSA